MNCCVFGKVGVGVALIFVSGVLIKVDEILVRAVIDVFCAVVTACATNGVICSSGGGSFDIDSISLTAIGSIGARGVGPRNASRSSRNSAMWISTHNSIATCV